MASITLAKCKRTLSFNVDETECKGGSLQNVIVTVEMKDGSIKDVVLDGVVVLMSKSAEGSADEVIETFTRVRGMHRDWVDFYVHACVQMEATGTEKKTIR